MKPTNNETAKALNIVRDLLPFGLHDAIKGSWVDFCNNSVEYATENGISFHSGASKACIESDELDWVIKISFDCRDEMDDDMEIDYCRRELYNYERACEEGLEHYFAEIYKVGEIEGIEVYLQEKVEVDDYVEDDIDQLFKDYIYATDPDYYDEIENKEEREDALWEGIYEMETEEKIEAVFGFEKKLIEFVEKYEINDLHSGNYGYRGADLIIIDYSGWNVASIEEIKGQNLKNL